MLFTSSSIGSYRSGFTPIYLHASYRTGTRPVDSHAVMNVWALHDLGLQALDIVNLHPKIGAHSLRSVHAFGIAKGAGSNPRCPRRICTGSRLRALPLP